MVRFDSDFVIIIIVITEFEYKVRPVISRIQLVYDNTSVKALLYLGTSFETKYEA